MSSNRENSTLGARKKADVQIDTGRTNIKAADSNGIVGGKKVKALKRVRKVYVPF